MTESDVNSGKALQELQALDDRIEKAKKRLREFEPLLEEVDEPALELKSEVENTRSRIKEMKVEERRLELSADEKRARVDTLEERLKGVRNVREESAVSAELDLVKKALEGDETEALTLLDQIRKLELRLDEQEEALEEAREAVEPRRQELLAERQDVLSDLEELKEERDAFAEDMESPELRVYNRIRGQTGRRAVSTLTPDGACGNCFNMIPLQLQNEIRHGAEMIRCEACGVILAAAERNPEEEAEAAG